MLPRIQLARRGALGGYKKRSLVVPSGVVVAYKACCLEIVMLTAAELELRARRWRMLYLVERFVAYSPPMPSTIWGHLSAGQLVP